MPVAILARLTDGSFLVQVAGNQAAHGAAARHPARHRSADDPGRGHAAPHLPAQHRARRCSPVMVALEPYAPAAKGAAPASARYCSARRWRRRRGGQADPDHGAVSASLSDIGAPAHPPAEQSRPRAAPARPATSPRQRRCSRLPGAPDSGAPGAGAARSPSAKAACSTNRTWPNGPRASAACPSCCANRRCSGPRRRRRADTDPAAAQLVNQQLATQEQARVAWQGQVWPGQDMHWEIQKDAPDAERGRAGGDGRTGLAQRAAAALPDAGRDRGDHRGGRRTAAHPAQGRVGRHRRRCCARTRRSCRRRWTRPATRWRRSTSAPRARRGDD